jgi:hypothetical protein
VGQGHIHDFNPGIAPSGLFWTAHVPMARIEIDLGRTTASFQLEHFGLEDTIPNVPATVSLAMKWHGLRAELEVRDLVNGFAGSYRECSATIQWSAEEAGFSFVSDPASTSATRFAQLGRERNGIFFQSG